MVGESLTNIAFCLIALCSAGISIAVKAKFDWQSCIFSVFVEHLKNFNSIVCGLCLVATVLDSGAKVGALLYAKKVRKGLCVESLAGLN